MDPARRSILVSLLATAVIAAALYALWVRSGRPLGVEQVERHIDDA